MVIPAGPTAVQVSLARGLVGAMLKIRKETVWRSATGSPRPLAGSGFWNVSAKSLSEAEAEVPPLVIWSVQTPPEVSPARLLRGSSGLNRPKNGAPAASIDAGGLTVSSKTVLPDAPAEVGPVRSPLPTW